MGKSEHSRIASLYRLRETLRQAEQNSGMSDWPLAEKVVYAIVGHAQHEGALLSVAEVESHVLLGDFSRASIYRALDGLKVRGAIKSTIDPDDGRVHRLSLAD
ncbi:hypothetical protein [Litorivicinus lipolyticus]|uniref:hypothetical protein n=1 Tax=Litorivicinus lipolyticus TaxID=418701 RepID=UPI003B5BE4C5